MTLWLALETSGDIAGIAVRDAAGMVEERQVDGPRRHAGALLPLAAQLLAEHGGVAALTGVLVADGPGSFTGIRVAAAVAKALHAAQGIPVWVGSALAARAVRHAPAEGGRVLVATNALRSEAYAAVFDVGPAGITVVAPARTVALTALPAMLTGCAVGVLDLPPALIPPDVPSDADPVRIVRLPEAGASGAGLLGLLDRPGGARQLAQVDAWEPVYGRPVEAQSRWEEVHGRPLPHPLRTSG